MKNKLIRFLLLFTLFFSIQASANPINKINFTGLNFHSEKMLLEILPFKVGQNFNSSISDKIIDSLFETGFFSDISIIKDSNNLTINIKENPYIKYLDININKGSGLTAWLKNEKEFLTDEIINELIESNELSAGEIYTKRKLTELITLIEDQYIKSGYYNVLVDSQIDLDQQNKIGVELNITQGNKATIGSLNISGNDRLTETRITEIF